MKILHVGPLVFNKSIGYENSAYGYYDLIGADGPSRVMLSLCDELSKLEGYDVGTMLPEQTNVVCDAEKCQLMMNHADGLGQGRLYATEPEAPTLTAMFSKGVEYLGNTTDKVLNYFGGDLKKPEFNYLNRTLTDGSKSMGESNLGSNEV